MPAARSADTAAATALAALQVGKARAQDAAQRPRAPHPPPDVPGVGLHPLGAPLVEADLEQAGRLGQRLEVAAFIPRAAARPRHRRDDRHRRVVAHRVADFGDQRRHHVAAPGEEGGHRAIGPRVGQPEGLGHVVGNVEIAVETRLDVRADLRLQAGRIDPRLLRAGETMVAEAEAELAVEPAVLADQREFVMVAVGVGHEARRLERDPGDRIIVGHVLAERHGIGARFGRRRAEVVDQAVAEGVPHAGFRMKKSQPRIVHQHQPGLGRDRRRARRVRRGCRASP